MMAVRGIAQRNLGLAPGTWRFVALGFLLAALAAGGYAAMQPQLAGLSGIVLLGGIGAVGAILIFAIWPWSAARISDARRVAEAAARANVAWAITSTEGAVVDCNDVYRRM